MSEYFVQRQQCNHLAVCEGVDLFTMAGEQMMMSIVEFEANAVVDAHSHPHEQLGILLEGELVFTVGEEQKTLRPGDMWRIPGGVVHRVVAGNAPARAVDIFHPIREDYL